MALEGPRLHYGRIAEPKQEDSLAKALDLAHRIEELLEDTRTLVGGRPDERTSSTRMARAIAASLTDELEALTRGAASAKKANAS